MKLKHRNLTDRFIAEKRLIPDALVDIDPDYAVSASDLPNRGTGGSGYDLDTNVGTAANRKIHPSGSCLLFGAGGDYVSTPDSAAKSVTDDITLEFVGAADDWTPATPVHFMDGGGTSAPNFAYFMRLQTNGTITLDLSEDGTNRVGATSSEAPGFTNGEVGGIRAKWDQSANSVVFEKSTDGGTTWAAFGSTQTLTLGGINDSSAGFSAGSDNAGNQNFPGYITRVKVYNDATASNAVVDFDPTKHVSGTTFSSGGVTFTLNGNARIQNTGHDTLSSIAGNALETASGQDIAVFTRYLVLRAFTSSPSGDQVFFDARSDSAKSVRLITDNSDSNKWALDAGGTPIVVDGAYDTNWHVITIVSNGANSLLRVSGVGEIEGNPGSEALDFGTLLADLSGSNGAPCEIARDITFNYAHSATQRSSIEGYLEAQYSV